MAVGMDALAPVVRGAALILEICGAVLVMYGGVYAALGVIQREVLKRPITYQTLRRDFTTKIVFGLEFLIAADIIDTILSPTLERAGRAGCGGDHPHRARILPRERDPGIHDRGGGRDRRSGMKSHE